MRHPSSSLAAIAAVCLTSCAPGVHPGITLSDAELRASFEALHRPIYEVYDLPPDRDAVWELLASSFTGAALTREYIEHFSTLVRMEEEETAIAVLQVDYDGVDVLERRPDVVRFEVDWSVGGVVTHRGHNHPRVNRYRAVYTIQAGMADGGDGLRIVDTRMKDLSRVRSQLNTRSGWSLDDAGSSGSGRMDPSALLRGGMSAELDEPFPEEPVPESSSPEGVP